MLETKNNKLTLIIIMHNQFESIDHFLQLFVDAKNKDYEAIFAFDTNEKNLSNEKKNKIIDAGFKVYFNCKNMGKVATIINVVQFIETPFFKIVDQDDSIAMWKIKDVNNELEKIEENSLVKHVAAKIFKKNNDFFFQTNDANLIKHQLKIGKDVHWAQQVNCDTIYPTKIVKEMSRLNISRQDFHNDVLISNFCIGMGSKLKKINSKFYIHFHNAGQTSTYNSKRAEAIPELYENYLLIKQTFDQFDFRKLMLGMKISHVYFAKNFTKWYLNGKEKSKARRLYNKTLFLIKKNLEKK